MKPAAFEYFRPADLDEACAMLAAAADDARLIAGGQTLVPLMAMRLARPTQLIDIARLGELAFVRREADAVTVGATTKQCVLERDPVIGADVPLLAKVMPFVGHAAIRARGTLGGSLANADPAAEIALAAVILDATMLYRDGSETFEIRASDFFTGPMMTALPASSCLTAVRFPTWQEPRIGVGFHEVSARRSDFAFASAGAQIALDENGACRRLALGVGAITSVPVRLDALARSLEGKDGDTFGGGDAKQARLRDSIRTAVAEIEPFSDLHASAEYRRRAATSLLLRAIEDAYRAANGRGIRAH